MAYNVALVDCTDNLDSTLKQAVTRQLTIWLCTADSVRTGKSASGTCDNTRINLSWKTYIDSRAEINLVLYFVPDLNSSVIKLMPAFKAPSDWDTLAGLTWNYFHTHYVDMPGGKRINKPIEYLSASELYVAKSENAKAAQLAAAAFHEAMHNQLNMGDEMHTDQNVGGGIAAASGAAAPSEQNYVAFAKAMGIRRPQWIEGYARAHQSRQTK